MRLDLFQQFDELLNKSDEDFSQALKNDKNIVKVRALQNKTLLHYAIRQSTSHPKGDPSYIHKIKTLLEEKSSLTAKDDLGRTPIHVAVQYGDAPLIFFNLLPLLLAEAQKQKFDFNQRDGDGNTILRWACEKSFRIPISGIGYVDSHENVVARILKCDKNIDLNIGNNAGQSPLFSAIQTSHLNAAILLVSCWRNCNSYGC